MSFCWWLPSLPPHPVLSSHSETEMQPAHHGPASTTFHSISRPEKSSQMWRLGGGWLGGKVLVCLAVPSCALSVTKLTSIVNHRNRHFSRPSRPAEYWKPRLELFASSDVNNSLTLESWLNTQYMSQSQTCINPFYSMLPRRRQYCPC